MTLVALDRELVKHTAKLRVALCPIEYSIREHAQYAEELDCIRVFSAMLRCESDNDINTADAVQSMIANVEKRSPFLAPLT